MYAFFETFHIPSDFNNNQKLKHKSWLTFLLCPSILLLKWSTKKEKCPQSF